MSNNVPHKEKFIDKKFPNYSGCCPECREIGVTRVLPFSDDSYYCENPHCDVIRHSNTGYYRFTNDDINLHEVNFVQDAMVMKRK